MTTAPRGNDPRQPGPGNGAAGPAPTGAGAANTPTDAMPASTVTVHFGGPERQIAYVRLNRPDKLNSLTLPMLEDLRAAAARIARQAQIRVVILSGSDENFSAGLDFASALRRPPQLIQAFIPRPWRGTNVFQEAAWAWQRLPIPVLAAVQGYCFGGGLQIALGADYRFTTADAQWSVLEAKWGLIPDMSVIHTLSQLVGADVARKLTYTGEVFDGQTAVRLGLASEVATDPTSAAEALAEKIIARSPDSVATAKRRRCQVVEATRSRLKASRGVRYPRVARGRSFISSAIAVR